MTPRLEGGFDLVLQNERDAEGGDEQTGRRPTPFVQERT